MEDRKNLYIVLDGFGNPWGPFETSLAAATWAAEKWETEGAPTRPGYQIVALRAPEE